MFFSCVIKCLFQHPPESSLQQAFSGCRIRFRINGHSVGDVSFGRASFALMTNAKYTPLSPKSSTAETGGADPFAGQAVTVSKRLKLIILCAVTLQNAGYALVRRYSRG